MRCALGERNNGAVGSLKLTDSGCCVFAVERTEVLPHIVCVWAASDGAARLMNSAADVRLKCGEPARKRHPLALALGCSARKAVRKLMEDCVHLCARGREKALGVLTFWMSISTLVCHLHSSRGSRKTEQVFL